MNRSSSSTEAPEEIHPYNTEKDDFITITEKIKLRKNQHEVLKIICDTYQTSFSGYIQEALIEAIKFDIEEGNFCDALLEKIGDGNIKNDNSSPSFPASDMTNNDLDLLKKLQTRTP
jgi:hypothetical protein